MSSGFDNKKLLYVLGILAVVLLLTFILKVPKEKATLKGSLAEFDTTAVNKIVLIPKKSEGDAFEFIKENGKWKIKQGNIVADPASGAVRNIFDEILSLKPRGLAAIDKSKWKEFELTDSLATRLKFLDAKDKVMSDILIGKFTYRQIANPYNGYGGNNIEGTSYVRVNGEDKIYSVDGFLAFTFRGKFNDWRNGSLIRCKKDDILKITFTLPGDSSYVVMKKDKSWFADNQPADSTAVANYLNTLAYLDAQDFKDGFNPVSNPAYQVVVEGNNFLNLTVKCFLTENTGEYILNSSQFPDTYFASKKDGIFSRVIKPKSYFLKK
jgi:Domain of unknown function (DUF4340)